MLDRANAAISIIASAEGGMDIEEVAEKHSNKIIISQLIQQSGYMIFI